MARNLNELEQSLAYDLGQDSVTVGGADFNRYLDHFNRGIREWASRHNHTCLRQSATFSVALNTATYSLTSTFLRPMGSMWLTDANGATTEYPIIKAEEKNEKDTSANYVWLTGSKKAGFSLNINPTPSANDVGTNNAQYWYVKEPVVFVNSGDTCEVQDEDALICYGRMREYYRDDEDAKAAKAEQEWEFKVGDMIAQDASGPEGAIDYQYAKSYEEKKGWPGIGS